MARPGRHRAARARVDSVGGAAGGGAAPDPRDAGSAEDGWPVEAVEGAVGCLADAGVDVECGYCDVLWWGLGFWCGRLWNGVGRGMMSRSRVWVRCGRGADADSCAGCDGFYGDAAVYCGSLFGDCFWLVSQDCTDIRWWLVGQAESYPVLSVRLNGRLDDTEL